MWPSIASVCTEQRDNPTQTERQRESKVQIMKTHRQGQAPRGNIYLPCPTHPPLSLSNHALCTPGTISYPNLQASASRLLPPNNSTLFLIISASPVASPVAPPLALEDASSCPPTPAAPDHLTPLIEAYLASLAINSLIFSKQPAAAYALSVDVLALLCPMDRPFPMSQALSPLLSKVYRYCHLAAMANDASISTHSAGIAGTLLLPVFYKHIPLPYRSASLSSSCDVAGTLLNLMLKNLLDSRLISSAVALVSNTTFPVSNVSNSQSVRFHYYNGLLKAMTLDYVGAHSSLLNALRKLPVVPAVPANTTSSNPSSSIMFRLKCTASLVCVKLLMGEIPARNLFEQSLLDLGLDRYLSLTVAVKEGSLSYFKSVVASSSNNFAIDGMTSLIGRLEHTVVKAGLKKVNTSYSRISLKEVGRRLGLEGGSDVEIETKAEFIVAKGIRDGVVEGNIDHENKTLVSNNTLDIYSTTTPTDALHRRITFCLSTQVQALASLRYPNEDEVYGKMIENVRRKKKDKDKSEEEKTDEEVAREIEEELEEEEEF